MADQEALDVLHLSTTSPTPISPAPSPAPTAPQNAKRKQLSTAMEHIRYAVTLPDSQLPSQSSQTPPAPEQPSDPDVYGMPGYIQPLRKPRTESSANPQKRTDPFQFGSRFLEEGDDIFSYNAWDHVETDEEYRSFAEGQYAKQREDPVGDDDKSTYVYAFVFWVQGLMGAEKYMEQPEKWWNKFYKNNTSNFFKDRKWLHQEFPVLKELSEENAPAATILEVGAGAGNTAFPVMKVNKNPRLRLHASDFSKKAIEVIRASPDFSAPEMIGTLEASVWDITSPLDEAGAPQLPEGLEPGSVDVVILIFIFSALAPSQWQQAMDNVWALLKPGGIVLFRDYGRGDLAQVRFKKGRWMEENFYVRGDGTRVYFFDEEELREMWTGNRLRTQDTTQADDTEGEELSKQLDAVSLTEPLAETRPKFEIVNFGVDRRMLVNRQRRLKMYRCWMQAKFRKPETTIAIST